jgi:hypothetical protein
LPRISGLPQLPVVLQRENQHKRAQENRSSKSRSQRLVNALIPSCWSVDNRDKKGDCQT